jgi:hypothetical protein
MKHSLRPIFLVLSLFILIGSCKKDSDNSSQPPSSGSTTGSATITGRAVDESNNAVANASVIISGQTTTTDQYGIFLLKDVSVGSRCIASITKTGFFNCTYAFIPKANTVNYIKVMLMSNAQTHTLSASAGGTVTLSDGSSILFASNSFVIASTGSAYTGTVSLSVKHLSPDASNFGFMIPGGDLLGSNTAGKIVSLNTYGMLGAELKGSSGEKLQLASSTTATLMVPIAATQAAAAPSSLPLWYFDEATSIWKEQGTATRSGNIYVGTVSHFSWWNCDYPCDRARIMGKVLDCNSAPIPNVTVTVNGTYTLVTDQSGYYSSWVPAGIPLTIQVLAFYNNNIFYDSQVENVPPLAVNQIYNVPDLILICPAAIAGTLKTCQGVNTAGGITASWTGGFNYQYTTNGDFNLACRASTTVDVTASANYNSFYYTFTGQYQSPAANSTNNIGGLLLCNQVTSAANDFTINGGPFSNVHFIVDTTVTWAALFSGSIYKINVQGTAPGYPQCNFALLVDALSIHNFPWSNATYWTFSADILDGTSHYMVQASPSSGGSTTITYAGNRVIGSFSGNAQLYQDSAFTFPVTISGNFDVSH